MYPRDFLQSYWRNDLENMVFVAMSFNEDHLPRWDNIFKPAIESVRFKDTRLRALRVDTRRTGQVIHTAILDGIAHSQLVLADISVQDRWMDLDSGRPRFSSNDNVMYEVGIATACRQPIEVILVRDDLRENTDERPPFDVLNIPYTTFYPANPARSVQVIRDEIATRLNERKLTQDLRFTRVLQSLSPGEVQLLLDPAVVSSIDSADTGVTFHNTTMRNVLVNSALTGLFDKELIRVKGISRGDPPSMQCRLTDFGEATVRLLIEFRVRTQESDAIDESEADSPGIGTL